MKVITNKFIVWLMGLTRMMRYFVIALLFHVVLLVFLGTMKIVAYVPGIVARFSGTTLPPTNKDVPDDPYAAYRDFDYNGPTLGGGGGLGGKGPGGVPTGGKAAILSSDSKGEAPTVGEVISVVSDTATAINRPSGTPGAVGIMTGLGTGVGIAGPRGPGGPWLGVGRLGPQRSVNLKKFGGSAETEKAVLAALRWLKAHQEKDGSWGMGCPPQAATALAILAYCGHGETPDSAEFGQTITRAFQYQVSQVSATGEVGGSMYIQGLTGLALAEAYMMTSSPVLKDPLERVVKVILKAQDVKKTNPIHEGGWRYAATSVDADLSVAGWQIMALKSAKSAGIELGTNTMERASEYVWNMYGGPGFGYSSPSTAPALTGVGVLCQQFLAHGSDPRLRPALDYLAKMKMEWDKPNIYGWYYITQAMFQGGRSYWTNWNKNMREVLLKNQKDAPPKDAGAWEFAGPGGYGPVYSTTLCTLMLEVYYRYLPMYQLTDVSVTEERTTGALPKPGQIPTIGEPK